MNSGEEVAAAGTTLFMVQAGKTIRKGAEWRFDRILAPFSSLLHDKVSYWGAVCAGGTGEAWGSGYWGGGRCHAGRSYLLLL